MTPQDLHGEYRSARGAGPGTSYRLTLEAGGFMLACSELVQSDRKVPGTSRPQLVVAVERRLSGPWRVEGGRLTLDGRREVVSFPAAPGGKPLPSTARDKIQSLAAEIVAGASLSLDVDRTRVPLARV